MQRIKTPFAALVLAAFAVACDEALTVPETDAPPIAFSVQTTAGVPVFDFVGPTLVPGASSKITRNSRGVTATLNTSGLMPGNAYTMWMVVFNEPDECATTPCTGDDVAPGTAAVVDVIYVAGNVVGSSGTATFSGRRAAGDNSKSLFTQLGADAPGLIDPRVAPMHLVVRDPGPAIPGQHPSQLQTFDAACTPASSFGLGSGANVCADVQFSIHLPS